MSSEPAAFPHRAEPPTADNKIVPMFVCPGAKDVPLGYAVFPLGGGFSHLRPCPVRDLCTWYAAHDLGGSVEFNALPDDMLLDAEFMSAPFSCPHFQDHAELFQQVQQRRLPVKRSCHG